jgi:acyl-CoA thioesterase-1
MPRFLALVVFLLFPLISIAAPPRPLLVLGDSLSAAYRIPTESGWVALLEQRLKSSPPVVNAAISGETTAGGLARLPKLLDQHKPALVVVELGANDALRGLPLDQIRTNLKQIVKLSRDAGAGVLLVGIEIPVNYGPQYRDGFRAMYRDIASEFNVPLVPFLLDGVALDENLMQEDGLHPKAAGEPKVLENVWPMLLQALGKR